MLITIILFNWYGGGSHCVWSYYSSCHCAQNAELERGRATERERENDNGQEKLIILFYFFVNPKPPSFSAPLSVCQPCYMHRTDERLAPVCVLTWTVSWITYIRIHIIYTHATHYVHTIQCRYIFSHPILIQPSRTQTKNNIW